MWQPPPRVLDEYCDPVDLKKNVTNAEGGNLLGGCAPNHLQPDDDYSVPYEVKKIMPGMSLQFNTLLWNIVSKFYLRKS